MKIRLKKDYAEERRKHYMSIGDQLDAIYELAKHFQENGERFPEKVVQWINQVDSVKKEVKKI
ncbi:MAG: hypothetical protein WAU54_12560 [Chania sp.]